VTGLSLAGVPASTLDNAAAASPSRPKNVQDAAQQFEALLISEMLRSERESGNGWLGTGDDSSGDCAVDFAEQQLASELAHQGGLGLAGLISSGLEAYSGSATDSNSPPSTQAPNPVPSGS
jgi:Rod binding domain-containing protein